MFNAVTALNDHIFTKKAEFAGENYAFRDVCSKWMGKCVYHNYLSLLIEMTNNGTRVIYPYHEGKDGTTYNLNSHFGDVTVDENRTVMKAHSFMLAYFVRFDDKPDVERSSAWLNELRDFLLDYDNPHINVYFMTSLTVSQEIAGLISTMVPLIIVMVGVTLLFSVGSLMVRSRVRSKPWVALSGLLVCMFGIMSSLGLMAAIGVPFETAVGAMPPLIFGKCC